MQIPMEAQFTRTSQAKRSWLSRHWRDGIIYLVLIVLAIGFLFPLGWLLSVALKTPAAVSTVPVQWLPVPAMWHNFIDVFQYIPVGQYLLNTIELAAISTILTTLSSALVGFAFARLRGVGKRPIFILMLSTLMLPQLVTVIPSYVLMSRLQIADSYWPWVLWGLAGSPFCIFLFRQFFSAIPQDLEDAAIVDGCSYFRMFWNIFLPLSRPVIATVVIITFTAVWGDWVTPKIFLDLNNTTLGVGVTLNSQDPHGSQTNLLAAATIIYLLPIVIMFLAAQRYFIRSIVTTGTKG